MAVDSVFYSNWGQVIFVAIAIAAGIGALLGTFRGSRGKTLQQALSTALAEVATYQAKALRLEEEVNEYKRQLAELSGRVGELSRQNTELRDLVMMKAVPQPLLDALSDITGRATATIIEVLQKERLR